MVVTKDETTIVEGNGGPEDIKGRVNQIRAEIENTDSDWDREKLKERLAKLAGGVAVIKAGAAAKEELIERKRVIERAVSVSRAAVREGIVPGGTIPLVRAQAALADQAGTGDEAARDVVHRARSGGFSPSSKPLSGGPGWRRRRPRPGRRCRPAARRGGGRPGRGRWPRPGRPTS